MAKFSKTAVTRKNFMMCVSEDIDHPVRWSLKENFRSLIELKSYKTPSALKKGLAEHECHYLILDNVVCDPVIDLINEIHKKHPTIKMLVVLHANATGVEQKELKVLEPVDDVIKRPFSPERLNECLYETFGFQKPKEINIFELKKGMVASEDIYSATSKEPLVACGVVMDDADIERLIKSNVKRVKVHGGAGSFLNCWEVKNCGCLGRCPASVFLDADGFLGGVNAGRGCMFVKDTMLERDLIKGKTFAEKVKVLCSRCEFCKIVATESKGKVSHSNFVEHIKKNKGKKTVSSTINLTNEKPKIN